MSTEGILRTEEGLSLKMYKCTAGYWTIAYGYNIQKRGLPHDICEELLRRDLMELSRLAAQIPEYAKLDVVRRGVLERMVYQMGVDGVLAFNDFRAALAREDWPAAHAEMLDSKWARNDSPQRARREANRILRGIE